MDNLSRHQQAKMREGYGTGVHTINIDELIKIDPEEMTRRLLLVFEDPNYKPPLLPRVAMEVMRLAGDPRTTFNQVVDVIKTDPTIAAHVMKVAQSPLYSGRNKLRTLSDAVGRMGIDGLRNLVFEVSMSITVFRTDVYADMLEQVRIHSVRVAHVAQTLAKDIKVKPEEAFMGGLLHDIGIAAAILVLADVSNRAKVKPLGQFWYAIMAAHNKAGAILCRTWGLSAAVAKTIERHHHPVDGKQLDRMAACVALADRMVDDRFGRFNPKGYEKPAGLREPGRTIAGTRLASALGIDKTRFEALGVMVDGVVAEIT